MSSHIHLASIECEHILLFYECRYFMSKIARLLTAQFSVKSDVSDILIRLSKRNKIKKKV